MVENKIQKFILLLSITTSLGLTANPQMLRYRRHLLKGAKWSIEICQNENIAHYFGGFIKLGQKVSFKINPTDPQKKEFILDPTTSQKQYILISRGTDCYTLDTSKRFHFIGA